MSNSKYVRETGPGYQTIVRGGQNGACVCIATMDCVDWSIGQPLYVVDDGGVGLAVVTDPDAGEIVAEYEVGSNGPSPDQGPSFNFGPTALRELGVRLDADVRVYRRDEGGLRVVPADDDPLVATDGGWVPTAPIDWPFQAVVHGADVNRDCLALTGTGKPCTYNAYASNDLPVCNTHARVDDPDVVAQAHQWARISDGDQQVTVCVNCRAVWQGLEPETTVACPECDADVGDRCQDETSTYAAPIPPHPERRRRAYEAVDAFGPCEENPVAAVDDDQTRLVPDGGVSQCGRRTCDTEAAVTYTTMRGAIRTRCARHALEDGVDGIGPSRAEKILDEISLEELVEKCEEADGAHAPVALSNIDGIGPSTAAQIAEAVDQSGVAESIRRDDIATDGGGAETPLPGQERCSCGRLVSPEWSYCPLCGEGLPVADGGRLPESFETFLRVADLKDSLRCRTCGDLVDRRYLRNGECVGCRHRPIADGGPDACPRCGEPPETSYRCQHCRHDLVDRDRQVGRDGRGQVIARSIGVMVVGLVVLVGLGMVLFAGGVL